MVKMNKVVRGLVVLATACNVPAPPSATGGAKGATLEIVCSDFKSTNVALAKCDGTILSGSFVSSAATAPGLVTALSGDVEVPFVAPTSGRAVIIDRSSNVLTWMDAETAKVISQLGVSTGFASNPHDYVEVDATRAFVSRYGTNPTPMKQSFDQGGDLLIVDTTSFAIAGRIAMPEENAALQPCPDTLNWLGSNVVVTLGRISADFSMIGDGRFVGVSPSTNQVAWTVNVTGLQTCGRLVTSPSGELAAIACSSTASSTTNQFDTTKSDIVVYDATVTPPVELRRLGVAQRLGFAVQPQIAFASDHEILALTYGANATGGDTVIAVNAMTGDVTTLASNTASFVLSGTRCFPQCGGVCLVADAENNALRRWQVGAGAGGDSGDGGTATFTALSNVTVDPTVGLPPRDIGGL
jgi:hypothetical protein